LRGHLVAYVPNHLTIHLNRLIERK